MSLDRYFRYIRIIQSIHFLIIFHKSQFLQMFLQNRCDLSRFCKGGFGPSDQNDIIAFLICSSNGINAAVMIRLALFRWTAFPTFLEAVMPSLVSPVRFFTA